jgi:hypothetical protein
VSVPARFCLPKPDPSTETSRKYTIYPSAHYLVPIIRQSGSTPIFSDMGSSQWMSEKGMPDYESMQSQKEPERTITMDEKAFTLPFYRNNRDAAYRIRLTCLCGGSPNCLLYSLLNCVGLSYPTVSAAMVASSFSTSIKRWASYKRKRF